MRHKALLLAACASSLMLCSMSAADDAATSGGGGFDPDKKLKIKIPKDNGKSESVIRGSINGQSFAVAVDQEVEVQAAVAQAIADSGIKFEVVDDEGAGLPSASTAPLTGTATREAPAVDPLQGGGDDDAMTVPTLKGGDGDTDKGPASDPAAQGRDQIEGAANAEGQGIAAAGGARVGNDTGDKVQGDVSSGEDSANDHGSTSGKSGDEQKDDQAQDDQTETVAALKERIAKIDDVDALRAEHDAEANGAKRTTALAAIDQRIDALTQNQ